MLKNYFIQLADYNVWANDIARTWLDQVTDAQWEQSLVSSFDGIGATIVHVAGAESIWLNRLNKLTTVPQMPPKNAKKEVLDAWIKASQGLKTFIDSFDESKLEEELKFKRLNGEEYVMQHDHILVHVFNHSTYHRGQLVTMLRQVGFTAVSSTDMSNFFRK